MSSNGGTGGREVLESGFRVLRALPDADPRRQVSSVAELTSIPRSTVHRLLVQLGRVGAVELGADGRWAVSPRLVEVAGRAGPFDGIRTGTNRVLQALRAQTGAAVSLVVAAGTSLIALEIIPGQEDLPLDVCAGAELPDLTAAAVVFGPMYGRSPRARAFAAAVDDQEVIAGLTCYARLLTLPGGRRAALAIATPAARPAERFAAHVQRAANAIQALAAASTERTPAGIAAVTGRTLES
jgi:DNA-binding IclR family transcriptional regulator